VIQFDEALVAVLGLRQTQTQPISAKMSQPSFDSKQILTVSLDWTADRQSAQAFSACF
jgi:hypothetical protein